jgi:hypothetical protein
MRLMGTDLHSKGLVFCNAQANTFTLCVEGIQIKVSYDPKWTCGGGVAELGEMLVCKT